LLVADEEAGPPAAPRLSAQRPAPLAAVREDDGEEELVEVDE
jgi:hypothetical protein